MRPIVRRSAVRSVLLAAVIVGWGGFAFLFPSSSGARSWRASSPGSSSPVVWEIQFFDAHSMDPLGGDNQEPDVRVSFVYNCATSTDPYCQAVDFQNSVTLTRNGVVVASTGDDGAHPVQPY